MNDTVTIITSATGNQIVKSFGVADYQQLKFSPGSKFLVSQQHVHDSHSLASVIGGLETEPTKTVIRGLPLLPNKDIIANKTVELNDVYQNYEITADKRDDLNKSQSNMF